MLSPPQMTHNDFDFYEDLIRPLMQFLVQSNILTQANLEEPEFDEDELFDSSKLTSKEVKQQRKEDEKAEFIQVNKTIPFLITFRKQDNTTKKRIKMISSRLSLVKSFLFLQAKNNII